MLDEQYIAAALPGYDVGGEIGRGGWGVVFAAHHRRLDRQVAVKQLPRAFAADPAVRARFAEEARLLATFGHPHIVEIYDYVEHEGVCLLVMELLSGGSLAERHRATPLTPLAACAVTLAATTALHCAHVQGVLHRDMKPENLMFSRRNILKVTDFGIAKVITGTAQQFTAPGVVLGTPAFMAPEQARGAELTPATDIYALAIVLFELLSGSLPFPESSDPVASLYQRVHEDPVPLATVAAHAPPGVCEVIDRALVRDPSDRYPDAEEFGVALAEAACRSWGRDWLKQSGVELHGSGPILAAATSSSTTGTVSSPSSGPATVEVNRAGPTVASPVAGSAAPAAKGSAPTPAARTSVSAPGARRFVGAGALVAAVLVVAVATFLLTRGSGDDPGSNPGLAGSPDTGVTTTSTTTPPRPLPASGVLAAGRYETTKVEPGLAVTLSAGWETVMESSRSLILGRAGRPTQSVHITWAESVVDPARAVRRASDLEAAALPAPPASDLVSWLQRHPRLTTSNATPSGGVTRGTTVSLSVKDGYSYEQCPRPCVLLFPHFDDESVVGILQGEPTQLTAFAHENRALAVLATAGPSSDQEFFAEVDALLSTLAVAPRRQ